MKVDYSCVEAGVTGIKKTRTYEWGHKMTSKQTKKQITHT
jgi:ribosomal protein L37E